MLCARARVGQPAAAAEPHDCFVGNRRSIGPPSLPPSSVRRRLERGGGGGNFTAMSVWSELSGPWGLGAEETVALVEKAIRSCRSYSAENLCRGIVPGDYNKHDTERENWPCRVMLPILPIQSISSSGLL